MLPSRGIKLSLGYTPTSSLHGVLQCETSGRTPPTSEAVIEIVSAQHNTFEAGASCAVPRFARQRRSKASFKEQATSDGNSPSSGTGHYFAWHHIASSASHCHPVQQPLSGGCCAKRNSKRARGHMGGGQTFIRNSSIRPYKLAANEICVDFWTDV